MMIRIKISKPHRFSSYELQYINNSLIDYFSTQLIIQKIWVFQDSIRGICCLLQVDQTIPHDQTNDQSVVYPSNRLSVSRYERNHIQVREGNSKVM